MQAGKGRDFGRQVLAFHSLGDLQVLSEFLEKRVIITIEKGDRAQEGKVYQGLRIFSLSDFQKASEGV